MATQFWKIRLSWGIAENNPTNPRPKKMLRSSQLLFMVDTSKESFNTTDKIIAYLTTWVDDFVLANSQNGNGGAAILTYGALYSVEICKVLEDSSFSNFLATHGLYEYGLLPEGQYIDVVLRKRIATYLTSLNRSVYFETLEPTNQTPDVAVEETYCWNVMDILADGLVWLSTFDPRNTEHRATAVDNKFRGK